MKNCVIASLFCLLVSVGFCSEPIWENAEADSTDRAVVSVSSKSGNHSEGSSGSGVVYEVDAFKRHPTMPYSRGKILTAKHVIQSCTGNACRVGDTIRVDYTNGRASYARVHKISRKFDVAVLVAWIPDGINGVDVSKEAPSPGEKCRFVGLGGLSSQAPDLKKLRRFYGTIAVVSNERELYSHAPLVSGDSGGPVFQDGKIVGIMSGGMQWFQLDATTSSVTWPARSVGVHGIRDTADPKDMPEIPETGN